MKAPRTDGLYIKLEEDGRSFLRFLDDGTVVATTTSHAESPRRVLEWLAPSPKKGSRLPHYAAPVRLEGERLRFTTQELPAQVTYEGTWAAGELVLDVTSTEGARQSGERYVFVASKQLVADDKKALAHLARPAATEPPSPVPPASAKRVDWGHWQRLVAGNGEKLTPQSRVYIQSREYVGKEIHWLLNPFLLEYHIARDGLTRVGDTIRGWKQTDDGVRIVDYTAVRLVYEGPHPPIEGGAYLGPEEDGLVRAIWFLKQSPNDPVLAAVARAPRKILPSVLRQPNKPPDGVFLVPAPVTIRGNRIEWLSQTGLREQCSFEGSWSNETLVLDEHPVDPSSARSRKAVTYTWMPSAELAAAAKAAPKASVPKQSGPSKATPRPTAKRTSAPKRRSPRSRSRG